MTSSDSQCGAGAPAGVEARRRGDTEHGIVVILVALFLALRLAFVFARDPFYDELFTRWMSRRSFADILEALRHDSGPPLYYWLVRLSGLREVVSIRVLSVVFALIGFVAILRAKWLGDARFTAALLLAVYPPAIFFAADARAYALCATFVTLGVLVLDRDRPWMATFAFVLAAYSHYYGVFFFPLLLLTKRRIATCAAAGVLFIPGFLLALNQPRQAIAWMRLGPPFTPLLNVSFAGDYPLALYPPLPMALIVTALILLVVSVGLAALRRQTAARAAAAPLSVLVPLALVIAFSLAGRGVYVAMRFESIIAAPLALWIAVALQRHQPRVRMLLRTAFVAIGFIVALAGIVDHLNRDLDPFRQAAYVAARNAAPGEPIVATGYCYLEVLSHVRSNPVIPFPPDQAIHPGWRRTGGSVEPESLPPRFLLVAESGSLELNTIAATRNVRPFGGNTGVVVARVTPRM